LDHHRFCVRCSGDVAWRRQITAETNQNLRVPIRVVLQFVRFWMLRVDIYIEPNGTSQSAREVSFQLS
jgi:hypothetical protein